MNEQLQLALKAVLEKALATLDTAVDFLSGQIPVVVQEVLLWNLTSSLIQFLFCVTVSVVSTVLLYKNWGKLVKMADGFGGFLAVVLYLCGIVFAWCQWMNLEWLKIWLAPRLWLVEYAASLVK